MVFPWRLMFMIFIFLNANLTSLTWNGVLVRSLGYEWPWIWIKWYKEGGEILYWKSHKVYPWAIDFQYEFIKRGRTRMLVSPKWWHLLEQFNYFDFLDYSKYEKLQREKSRKQLREKSYVTKNDSGNKLQRFIYLFFMLLCMPL